MVRTQDERRRQEALFQTHSTTEQKVEQAVADQQRFAAQFASRDADLAQAKTALRSSELAAEKLNGAARTSWNLKEHNSSPTSTPSRPRSCHASESRLHKD